jgi:D-alanyl-D-alanine carboxypeptidase
MQPCHVGPSRPARYFVAMLLLAAGCGVHTPALTVSAPAPAPGDSLDAWVASLMAEKRIPGLSLVVIRNGRVARAGHYGMANVELNVPVNEETSFRIASMSKAFTAAAVMLLVEDGRLALDDRVTSHLDDLPQAWRDITLRQLLNNTSGLSNDWDLNPRRGTDPETWTVHSSDYFLRNTTDDDFLRALADLPLLFPPGERYSYAAGTFVAGRVIEKVAGVPYAEFMRVRIFEPLGMTRTMINDSERIVPHRAGGYRLHGDVLMRGYRLSPAADARGDVGVLTTALDLAKWDAAMRDTRLLSRSSLDELGTRARLNDGSTVEHGLGWSLWPSRGFGTMSHGGTFRTGFSSEISRYVDLDMTVIVVANLWAAFLDRDVAQEIASFYDPAFRLASTMQPRLDPDPARSRMLRSVIGLVARASHDPALMTADFPIAEYTTARWQERHEGLSSFVFVDCESRDRPALAGGASDISEVCFYSFSEPRGAGYLVFMLARDGKVVDLYTEEFRVHP